MAQINIGQHVGKQSGKSNGYHFLEYEVLGLGLHSKFPR